jgi:hypothetical protein
MLVDCPIAGSATVLQPMRQGLCALQEIEGTRAPGDPSDQDQDCGSGQGQSCVAESNCCPDSWTGVDNRYQSVRVTDGNGLVSFSGEYARWPDYACNG